MEVENQSFDLLKPHINSIYHKKPCKILGEAFEIRVIYMRLVSSLDMPSCIKIIFPPRNLHTSLHINGLKINPYEKIARTLNMHRRDAVLSESIYVNTDRIKFSGPFLPFEIHMQGGIVLVSGGLRRKGDGCMWLMECREGGGIRDGNGGLADVYFAGRSLGRPLLLNEVVELKKKWHGLCCIPEGDETVKDTCKEPKEKVVKEIEDAIYIPNYKVQEERFLEEDDEGEISWFNAGVRVGMGLGLGMCLSVGVGLGLFMRTYQTTAGVFRRFL